jgi:hypothetical protein
VQRFAFWLVEAGLRVARFFLVHYTKQGKIYQIKKNKPNGHKICIPNGHLIYYKRLPLQDPTKCTKIGIFGLKYIFWQTPAGLLVV